MDQSKAAPWKGYSIVYSCLDIDPGESLIFSNREQDTIKKAPRHL